MINLWRSLTISEDSIDVTNTNDGNIETDLSKQDPQTPLLYNQTTYNYTQAVIFLFYIN